MTENKKNKDEKKEIKLSPEIAKYFDEWTANPKSKVFVKIAEEYRKCGLIEEAERVCEKGLSDNPNYLSGNMTLAKIYFDKGEYQKSLEQTKKVTTFQVDNLMAQNLLLDLYIKLGDKNNALKLCDVISFLDPKNEGILRKREEIKKGGLIQAEIFEEEKEEEPEEIKAAVEEELDLSDGQKEDNAEEEEHVEEKEFTTNTVAELYIKQGFYEKGFNIYKELLDESPNEGKLISKVNEIKGMIETKKAAEEKEKKKTSAPAEKIIEKKNEDVIASAEPKYSPVYNIEDYKVESRKEEVAVTEEKAEISIKEKQINRLNNWLGKIQSKGRR